MKHTTSPNKSSNVGRIVAAFVDQNHATAGTGKQTQPLRHAAQRYAMTLDNPSVGDLQTVYSQALEKGVNPVKAFARLAEPKQTAAQIEVRDSLALAMEELKPSERKEWSPSLTKAAWAVYTAEGRVSHLDLLDMKNDLGTPQALSDLAEEMRQNGKPKKTSYKDIANQPQAEKPSVPNTVDIER